MIKKIATTLEFGAVYAGAFLVFLYSALIMAIVATCLMLLLSVTKDSQLYIAFAICGIISICFLLVILINHKNCKKVKEWLKDSIPLKAYCKTLDESITFSGFLPLKSKKVIITFTFNGQTISKESGKKNQSQFSLNGYSVLIKKYADRKIDILYSPKYDQVMILKDKKS